jgi:hypothetical protein
MKPFFKAFVVAVVGVAATAAAADPPACKECDPQVQDSSKSHREQIKAERDRYDRENEKVIARPWDVTKGDKLLPEKK